jgi:hypothetical protein
MSSAGSSDRRGRGMLRLLRRARADYDGPFTGQHVRELLEADGYEAMNFGEPEALAIFRKPDCHPVPIDVDCPAIYTGDPTFECLRRDLGLSRSALRTRLNQIRQGIQG